MLTTPQCSAHLVVQSQFLNIIVGPQLLNIIVGPNFPPSWSDPNFNCLAQWQTTQQSVWGCPQGVMVKAIDYRIVVSEFELQSCYYVRFWTNTLGKGMTPLILPAMG